MSSSSGNDSVASAIGPNPKKAPALSDRGSHTASYFFGFCIDFVDQEKQKGRQFRSESQGMETAALTWRQLSDEEKQAWRLRFREWKKTDEKQRYRVHNGSRGSLAADPAQLARWKDPALKAKNDVENMIRRWQFQFANKIELASELFLIVSASPDTLDHSVPFSELAIVEFCIDQGIVDAFRIPFGTLSSDDMIIARYRMIRMILDRPERIHRRLNDGLPNYFVPPGQIPAVFSALTYVSPSTPSTTIWDGPQISLRDLASVADLRKAMSAFLNRPQPIDDETISRQNLNLEEDEVPDCLEMAQECAMHLIQEFGDLLRA